MPGNYGDGSLSYGGPINYEGDTSSGGPGPTLQPGKVYRSLPAPIQPPLGLEAVFEYRGLRLNDKNQLIPDGSGDYLGDIFRISEISGLNDIEMRDSRDVNPGTHGETAFQALYSGRTITLTGRIESGSLNRLRLMQTELRQVFGDLEEDWLYIRNYRDPTTDVQIKCRKIGPIAMNEVQQNLNYYRDFQLSLRASYPFFQSVLFKTTSQGFDVVLGYTGRIYPRVYPFVYATSLDSTGTPVVDDAPTPLLVTNSGDFPASPTIRITGGVTDPQISNTSNSQVLKLTTTVQPGEFIDIDTLNRTVVDNTGANRFAAVTADSDWIQIDPGNNQLTIQAGAFFGGSPIATITFRDTYL